MNKNILRAFEQAGGKVQFLDTPGEYETITGEDFDPVRFAYILINECKNLADKCDEENLHKRPSQHINSFFGSY